MILNYAKIYAAVLSVYKDCDIHSFPFSCKEVIAHYGYRLLTYHQAAEQNDELYEICRLYSEDAFLDRTNRLVLYNPHVPGDRPRFSQMHELGHIVLNHHGEDEEQEKEANMFAGMLLAPSMAIHYSRIRDASDLSTAFKISYDAATCALSQYYRWYEHILAYKMTALDKQMYQHFYDKEQNCFVWTRRECQVCHTGIVNSTYCICPSCRERPRSDSFIPVTYYRPRFWGMDPTQIEQEKAIIREENRWLYSI